MKKLTKGQRKEMAYEEYKKIENNAWEEYKRAFIVARFIFSAPGSSV